MHDDALDARRRVVAPNDGGITLDEVTSGVAGTFFAAAGQAERLIASEPVANHWAGSSALQGYSVSGLAGHLARAVLTVQQYIDVPAPPDAAVTDASGYLFNLLGAHHPVDSDFHRTVRARAAETSLQGPSVLAAEVGRARERLAQRFSGAVLHNRIEVLQGVVLTVEEYLRTRLVELVVHLDDLAVSVGQDVEHDLPHQAYNAAAVVLIEVAARRHGGLSVVRSLARREREPGPIHAL